MGLTGPWWGLLGRGGEWWVVVGRGGTYWDVVGSGGEWWGVVGRGGVWQGAVHNQRRGAACGNVANYWKRASEATRYKEEGLRGRKRCASGLVIEILEGGGITL